MSDATRGPNDTPWYQMPNRGGCSVRLYHIPVSSMRLLQNSSAYHFGDGFYSYSPWSRDRFENAQKRSEGDNGREAIDSAVASHNNAPNSD